MRNIVFSISLFLVVALVVGYGSREPAPAVAPAETPKAILKQCFVAMHQMDEQKYLACFDASEEERQALSSLIDFGKAMMEFRETFIKTYGATAWRDFQDPDKAPKEGNATFNLITEEDLLEIETVTANIEGDIATFPIPGEGREATAKKINGGWLMDATSFLPAGAEPKAFGDLMQRTGLVTRKYMKAIGYKNITPEDIDTELGRAWMKEMFGMTVDTKHRFEIDKLY